MPGVDRCRGLMYYLIASGMKTLLNRLTDHFPSGEMAFDAVNQLRIPKHLIAF